MADDGTRIPKLTSTSPDRARELETLPLSSIDGYVMSRIDGATNERDLAGSTGLTEESINDALGKLEFLGLIEYFYVPQPDPRASARQRVAAAEARPQASSPGAQKPAPNRAPTPSHPPSGSTTSTRPAGPTGMPPGAPAYDPRDLEEDVEIDREHRKKILVLFSQLEGRNHYQILGVPRSADKKAIKRAYFELASLFHPDRYFRKKLGSFKPKMDACFGRLTLAHDILTSKQRPEYDEYLGDVEVTQRLETGIAETEALELKIVAERNAQDAQLVLVTQKVELELTAAAKAPEPSRIEDLLQDALAAMAPGTHGFDLGRPLSMVPPPIGGFGEVGPAPLPPMPPPAMPPPAMARPAPASAPRIQTKIPARALPSSPAPPLISPNAQREAFARRLLGQSKGPPRTAPARAAATNMPAHHQMSVHDAMDALRRRYKERVGDARKNQALKHSENGAQAMAAKDPVAAANAYRLAMTLLPDDEALKQAFEVAQAAADVVMSESYLRQATYEEKSENWVEASKSWRKVAKARPTDAKAHERAAHAMVKASGDMHEASTLASRAVALLPKSADFRLTLAHVYLAAGLPKNARRELETAVKLSPDDANIQTLLKRAQKGV